MAKKNPQWLIDRAFNMDASNEKKVIGTLQILNSIKNGEFDYETALNILVENNYVSSAQRYEKSTQTLYKSYGLIIDKKIISSIGIELAEGNISFKEMLLLQLFKKQYNNASSYLIRPLVVVIKVLLYLYEKDQSTAWLDSYDYMKYLTEIRSYDEIVKYAELIYFDKTKTNRNVEDIKDSDIWANAFIASGLFEKHSDNYINSFKMNMEEIELLKYISENHEKSPLITGNWLEEFSNPQRGLPEILPILPIKKDKQFTVKGFSKDTIRKVINNKLIYGMTQRENDESVFFGEGLYEEQNRGFISQVILKASGLSSSDVKVGALSFLKNYSNILNYLAEDIYSISCEEESLLLSNFWLCSANSKVFDHESAFRKNGVIDLAQDKHFNNASVGDIVFIYCARPLKQVKYKCLVIKKDISKENKISDREFWLDTLQDEEYNGVYIRLKLLNECDDDRLKYENLLTKGLKSAPQGAFKLDSKYLKLAKYIDLIFKLNNEINTDKIINNNFDIPGKGKNLIVFGTPGCGKSYYVENVLLKDFPINSDNIKEHVYRTTFYQDYTNCDFVGQILPCIEKNEKGEEKITYKFNPGPFALALKDAVMNKKTDVALVIEELNRGNAPAIFGDIFQLLDRNENGVSRYSIINFNLCEYLNEKIEGANFTQIKIPGNLFIYATMNTSDQNVFTLDTAFKRRWKTIKLRNQFDPYVDALGNEHSHNYSDYLVPGLNNVSWKTFVDVINGEIIGDKGERESSINVSDKQIGVYFVDKDSLVKDILDLNGLSELEKREKIEQFAYKMFSYLWDDVAKFDKDKLFADEIITLDDLVDKYVNEKDVFIDQINKKMRK